MSKGRYRPGADHYVPLMTHEQAVKLYFADIPVGAKLPLYRDVYRSQTEAKRLWEEEFRRRQKAYDEDVSGAAHYFSSWRALECENCGGGPRGCACDGGYYA